MAIEFDDRSLNLVGNNFQGINFFDDDRTLQARIFLDDQNRLNVGNFQTEGGETGTEGGSLDLSDVGFLTIAATGSLNQERIFTPGDGISADDGGGNGNYTVSVKASDLTGSGLTVTGTNNLGLDTPGTLAHDGSNSATGNHTHAITASANPGAAASLLKSTASGGLTLELLNVDNLQLDGNKLEATSGDLTLDAAGGDVLLPSAINIGADNFVSELTGWRVTYAGSADFRDIFADELRVRAFIADIEQALAGGQIVSKSVALLSRDFKVPVGGRAIIGVNTTSDYIGVAGDHTDAIDVGQEFNIVGSTGNDGSYTVKSTLLNASGNTQINVNEDITDGTADGDVDFIRTIFVEDLPGFADTAVFVVNDWIRLRVIDRSGGGLVVADVWGQVGTYTDRAGGEQSWLFFCRDDGDVDGDVVNAGALALDYGASGDGYWEVTALGNDVPYSQIVTWATDPSVSGNHTLRTRVGNLDGVTDSDFPSISGFGFYSDNAFLKGDLVAAGGDVVIDSDGITIDAPTIQASKNTIKFVESGGSFIGQFYCIEDSSGDRALNIFLDEPTGAIGGDPRLAMETNDAEISTATLGARNVVIDGSDSIQLTGPGGTTITGDLTVDTDTLFVDASANRVGVGTTGPNYQLHQQTTGTTLTHNLKINASAAAGNYGEIAFQTWSGAGSGLNTFGGSGTSRPSVVLRGLSEDSGAKGAFVVATFGGGADNTNLTEKMRVTSGGNVGIGTGSPGNVLDVNGNTSAFLTRIFNDGNAANRKGILVQAGEDTNPTSVHVGFYSGNQGTFLGGCTADGAGGMNYTSSSDESIKTDITPLPPGALTRILALEPVTYRGKGAPPERGKRTGLIAQQVQEHVPDVVSEGEDGLLGISYGRLVPELIGAIQELNAELETLRGTV